MQRLVRGSEAKRVKFSASAGGFLGGVEAQMKTCPDCNGDGVVDKGRRMNSDVQRAVAVISCPITTTTMKKY